MAWYYWLWISTSILYFLDLYSTMMRATKRNIYGDLILQPIFCALFSVVWPFSLVYMMWQQKKERAVSD